MSGRRLLLVQIVVSLTVLGLLLVDVGVGRVRGVLGAADARWLVGAVLLQASGQTLRTVRIWRALRDAPLPLVMKGALAANLGHLAVPTKVADAAGAVWIGRASGLPVERAVAAYGTVILLEMIAFGGGLAALLAIGVSDVLEGFQRREALGGVSIVTIGAVGLAILGARLLARREGRVGAVGVQLRASLSASGLLLGAVQVTGMLGVFRFALLAIGVQVPAPWLTGALVMSAGALGGMILPPHMGANSTVSASLILTQLGATPAQALAMGGIMWLAALVPDVGLGLAALWAGGRTTPAVG